MEEDNGIIARDKNNVPAMGVYNPTTGKVEEVQGEGGNINTRDFLNNVSLGKIPGHSLVHKFGAGLVTTTLNPVSLSGEYKTPTTAVSLEFVSDSANDTSTGSGAREITITGLDGSRNQVTQTLVTNGVTPVTLATPLTRLFRRFVSSSGTYATATAGSHSGILTIRESGAGAVWSIIENTPFAIGQSEIGCYTIPTGYSAYLVSKNVFVDSSKNVDVFFFRRDNVDDVTVPYSGTMRLFEKEIGVTGGFSLKTGAVKGIFAGPSDIGFMAKITTGTGNVSAEFELLLIDNNYL